VPGWFLFNGFVKHDLDRGESWSVQLAPGRYGSEPVFAPRLTARSEDDGYLISFIIDENTHSSECILIDAARFADGPVCRIALPHKICSGTHAWWTDQPNRSSRS
jgi:carotenoid cleavage dioxygenase